MTIQQDSPADSDAIEPPRGTSSQGSDRLLLALGVSLAVLGVVAYVVQTSLQSLMAPWYMPILALLGLTLVAMALLRRRTVWRLAAFLVVGLLLGAELAFFYAVRLPAYTGPIAVGSPFPPFETRRADGTVFTERGLLGDRHSVLVFFRGRW